MRPNSPFPGSGAEFAAASSEPAVCLVSSSPPDTVARFGHGVSFEALSRPSKAASEGRASSAETKEGCHICKIPRKTDCRQRKGSNPDVCLTFRFPDVYRASLKSRLATARAQNRETRERKGPSMPPPPSASAQPPPCCVSNKF